MTKLLKEHIMDKRDRTILRDLAKQYADITSKPVQDKRRELWRKHNSLQQTRPLIYIRAFAWKEMEQSKCVCEDQFFRLYEDFLRKQIFRDTFNDDSILEPWITLRAVRTCYGWGIPVERSFSGETRGSFKIDYAIKKLSDTEKLRAPWHGIDEEKTSEHASRLRDMFGDIIEINIDRSPVYRNWGGDISTFLGYFRGIEHFMMDMADNPEWLKGLVSFIADGVLKTHNEAEEAGDWGLYAHENQAMPYSMELEDPAANTTGVNRNRLWAFTAAQEFTGVSPAMHDEFLLQYQMPILEKFGLVAYGCCEDLTRKIDMLRQVPNLRRIAVSPFADTAQCAEQIGRDYVLSYRPSPADMVSYRFDRDRVSAILRNDLEACRDCHVDITLKDVETVEGDPERVRTWVSFVREITDDVYG